MRKMIVTLLLLFSLLVLASDVSAQSVELGIEPSTGPTASFNYFCIGGVANYQFWYSNHTNELSNNVLMEGGYRLALYWMPAMSASQRFHPLLGIEHRHTVERPGNESVLFTDFYTGFGAHKIVYPPKSKTLATVNESNPDSEGYPHPGFVSDVKLRGYYDHIGIIVGLKYDITNLLFVQMTASYLPLFRSDTLEDQVGGTYRYADRTNPYFVDVMIAVNLLGN